MTRDELRTLWTKVRARKALRAYALRQVEHEEWDQITYIISLECDDEHSTRFNDELLAALRLGINSPFSSPYFRVTNDVDLMRVRMTLSTMQAWDFRTGKKVITGGKV